MIQGTTLLDQEIDNEIKRIETSQSAIKDYIDKIQQLNMDIEVRGGVFFSCPENHTQQRLTLWTASYQSLFLYRHESKRNATLLHRPTKE